jgi:hypothetical protein
VAAVVAPQPARARADGRGARPVARGPAGSDARDRSAAARAPRGTARRRRSRARRGTRCRPSRGRGAASPAAPTRRPCGAACSSTAATRAPIVAPSTSGGEETGVAGPGRHLAREQHEEQRRVGVVGPPDAVARVVGGQRRVGVAAGAPGPLAGRATRRHAARRLAVRGGEPRAAAAVARAPARATAAAAPAASSTVAVVGARRQRVADARREAGEAAAGSVLRAERAAWRPCRKRLCSSGSGTMRSTSASSARWASSSAAGSGVAASSAGGRALGLVASAPAATTATPPGPSASAAARPTSPPGARTTSSAQSLATRQPSSEGRSAAVGEARPDARGARTTRSVGDGAGPLQHDGGRRRQRREDQRAPSPHVVVDAVGRDPHAGVGGQRRHEAHGARRAAAPHQDVGRRPRGRARLQAGAGQRQASPEPCPARAPSRAAPATAACRARHDAPLTITRRIDALTPCRPTVYSGESIRKAPSGAQRRGRRDPPQVTAAALPMIRMPHRRVGGVSARGDP